MVCVFCKMMNQVLNNLYFFYISMFCGKVFTINYYIFRNSEIMFNWRLLSAQFRYALMVVLKSFFSVYYEPTYLVSTTLALHKFLFLNSSMTNVLYILATNYIWITIRICVMFSLSHVIIALWNSRVYDTHKKLDVLNC